MYQYYRRVLLKSLASKKKKEKINILTYCTRSQDPRKKQGPRPHHGHQIKYYSICS
jgi:hypothetical protein